MNYEKKYKEALERANKLYEQGTITESLGYVFPELKESKDERIRKGIIRNLEYLEDRAEGFVKDELKERIAWLEKQGEQKPTLPKWKYKKDNIPLLKDSLILNKYGCVAKSPSGAIVSDVWVLDYDELAKLPKGGEE